MPEPSYFLSLSSPLVLKDHNAPSPVGVSLQSVGESLMVSPWHLGGFCTVQAGRSMPFCCGLSKLPCALPGYFPVRTQESLLLFPRLTTRNLLMSSETTSRWKPTFYENIFHLNYMHCLPMFIASQREFGGKPESAKYGFDYRDLCQKWNGTFY